VSSKEEVTRTPKRAKKSTASAPTQSLLPSGIQDTICSSSTVIGKGLGKTKPPKTNCAVCDKAGHWRADCPEAWGKAGKPLLDFSSRGKRLANAWEDGNPTKETFAKWVIFLQDKDNFPHGARVFPRDGAPSLNDFKRAARHGAPS
jgi:hypothetical protein